MKFGCHLPVYGPAATRATILGFARRMESLGFDSLWASDHVVIPWKIRSRYPYNPTGDFPLSPETPFLEPLTTLAVVAGATEHIALGTTVLVLAHRHPVLLAKMLATLDQLSGGRVIVGAGVGWMKEEIELFGVDYQRRGAWSDEALRVLRACWREPRPRFEGTFFRFDELAVEPKPVRGDIPIWIGGDTPAALRRVAELGDGWHPAFPTPQSLGEALPRLRDASSRARRATLRRRTARGAEGAPRSRRQPRHPRITRTRPRRDGRALREVRARRQTAPVDRARRASSTSDRS